MAEAEGAETVPLKVRRIRPGAKLPQRATSGASGFDLFACLDHIGPIELTPDPALVPTGIAIEVPPGYDAQVRPRSGLSLQGVMAVFGTVDADYRGELFITMHVTGARTHFQVRHGDRIAQLIVSRLPDVTVAEVDELSPTERGDGGHGSTGLR